MGLEEKTSLPAADSPAGGKLPAAASAPAPASASSPATATATAPYTEADIERDATLVYDYHRMSMPLPDPLADGPPDAIFALCSLDLRVAERAAELFLEYYRHSSSSSSSSEGLVPREDEKKEKKKLYLIFSGGMGHLTRDRFPSFPSEAAAFAAVARRAGVPEEYIITEEGSTNTGENVRFTRRLLEERGLLEKMRSLVLVQKPYMERRTYATFVRQWPASYSPTNPSSSPSSFQSREEDIKGEREGEKEEEEAEEPEVKFTVTSPLLPFALYPDADNPRDLVISIMVGDLVRIREYPARGFQIPQEIPDEVWEAGRRLVALGGFGGHLPS